MMQEKILHTWWSRLPLNQQLTTLSGQKIIIHHPGIYNKYAGPDFRNAVITIDHTRFKGSVEIHVKTSDWFRHRHHLDNHYRDIILHVVWEHNISDNLHHIPAPVIELKKQTLLFANLVPQVIPPHHLKQWAKQRFSEKTDIYRHQLRYHSMEELIFTSIHKALGYPHNQYPFSLLAWYIWKIAETGSTFLLNLKPEILLSFLLINSIRNFPPSSHMYQILNRHLSKLNSGYFMKMIKKNPPPVLRFNFGGIHPVNQPGLKLSQLSTFYTHHTPRDFVSKIKSCLMSRRESRLLLNDLSQCFIIRTDRQRKSYLLSRNRITEWLLTDLIPLCYSATDSVAFREYLSHIYFTLPAGYHYGKAQKSTSSYGWENQAMLFHQHQII